MAHKSVRAALDKFVVLLESNAGAPIPAKHDTCPEHSNETKQGNEIGDDADRQRLAPKDFARISREGRAAFKQNNHHNEYCKHQDTQPPVLSLDRAFYRKCGGGKIDEKNRPTEDDEFFAQVFHRCT